jgi:endonuclease/exonuclease/phosphatase (EEP) superfamily protein YafD
MAMDIIRTVLFVLGYFILVVSLIPLIRNDNWMFRIFEYPRAQKLAINVAVLVAFSAMADWRETHPVVFACLLGANALYLFYQVFPYTFLARHQMKGEKAPNNDRHFKLLVCNVYQDNRDVAGCLNCIEKNQPHIIILVETDMWWKTQLAKLERDYPYRVMKPLDNTYGMLLYSKFELLEPKVKYIIEEGIPSIHTQVRLPSGDIFKLYCLHPQPPVPQENPRSTERDAEILTVGKEAKACKLPVIVAGDLNDVAWSYTTELFMKISGLLDPRRGRGFFNTFNVHYWFLRWPLDHIFCSKHFELSNLKRLPSMGSDHFPILVELQLNYDDTAENECKELEADVADKKMVEEKIQNAK